MVNGEFYYYFFVSFFMYAPEPLVLVRHEVQEQALGQVLLPLLVVHLVDDVLDLADGVFEGLIELPLGADLLVQRLEHGQQVAVQCPLRRRSSV